MVFLVLVFFSGGSTLPAFGQQAYEPDRPSVGLVLSGGSARGIAHIGVLKVLEEEQIPIDVITGTSMGSIVGGLYAMGYSAAQLEAIFAGADWDRLFSDRAERTAQRLEQRFLGEGVLLSVPADGLKLRLPGGLLAGQRVMDLLCRLTWAYHDVDNLATLPIPFTTIGTNLRTGEAVPLTRLPLPVALRASMSLPSIFTPVEVDGELYVDGGLARNIPAEDARRLGADILIGVDVGLVTDSTAMATPSFFDVLLEVSLFQGRTSNIEQRHLVDVLIEPDVEDLSAAAFGEVSAWVLRGEEAARAVVHELRAVRDSVGGGRPREIPAPDPVPLLVDRLEITGVNKEAADLIETRMNLELPAVLGPVEVDRAIQRVYGTGAFEYVTYLLLNNEAGRHTLRVEAEPQKAPDRFGVGLRYDSFYRGDILFSLTLKNRLRFGSTTEFRARLGEQNQVEGRYLTRMGIGARFMVGGRLGYASAPINLFLPDAYARATGASPDVPILGLRFDVVSAEFFSGVALFDEVLAGVQVTAEWARIDEEVAGVIPSLDGGGPESLDLDDRRILTAGLLLGADTFDQIDFPTRGVRLSMESEVGLSNAEPPFADSTESYDLFFRHVFTDLQGHVPLGPGISLFGRAALAWGAGDALPLTYYNFLGGVYTTRVLPGGYLPLYGVKTQARFGRKAYLLAAGAQWEVYPDVFVRLLANMGNTFDLLRDDEDNQLDPVLVDLLEQGPSYGFGLEFGVRTPIGPVQLIFSDERLGTRPDLSLNIGYAF